MTEKWPKPLSLCFNPLVSFTVTVILASVAVRQRGNERVYIKGGWQGSLNTATLNEGQSVLRLNVREDADAQEGNVSSQEASSGKQVAPILEWSSFSSQTSTIKRSAGVWLSVRQPALPTSSFYLSVRIMNKWAIGFSLITNPLIFCLHHPGRHQKWWKDWKCFLGPPPVCRCACARRSQWIAH